MAELMYWKTELQTILYIFGRSIIVPFIHDLFVALYFGRLVAGIVDYDRVGYIDSGGTDLYSVCGLFIRLSCLSSTDQLDH